MIDETIVTDWRKRHRQPGLTELAVCRKLRELAAHVPADQAIVELGAYAGRATAWLLLGAQDGNDSSMLTVDPWDMRRDGYSSRSSQYVEARALFDAHMRRIGPPRNTHVVEQNLAAEAGRYYAGPRVGLLYHDAEHTASAVETDLRAWLPHLADNAVIVLHDVNDPRMQVEDGARAALPVDEWDWDHAERITWAKRPNRRGALIIRRGDASQ